MTHGREGIENEGEITKKNLKNLDKNNHFAFSVVMNGIPNKVRTVNNMKFVQYNV